jgi:hypothetical protein
VVTVKLTGIPVDQALKIVQELKTQGFEQHVDFDFKWIPKVDDWVEHNFQPSHTEFFFYKDEHATMFALKYAQ